MWLEIWSKTTTIGDLIRILQVALNVTYEEVPETMIPPTVNKAPAGMKIPSMHIEPTKFNSWKK